jgi:hypothetical protein
MMQWEANCGRHVAPSVSHSAMANTMASEAKQATNRANARRSTGPRTAAGKAVAKLNAVSHGLRSAAPVVPGERAKDWHDHQTGMLAALAPVGTLETELVDRAALLSWRLRRVARYETVVSIAAVSQATVAPGEEDDSANPLAGFLPPDPFAQRTAGRIRKERDAAEENAASFAEAGEQFRRLQTAPADELIDGDVAFHLLREATGYTPNGDEEYTDIEADEFLADVGVPVAFRDSPDAWAGWTVGRVMAGVTIIAEGDGITAADLLARAVRQAEESAAEERERAAQLETELAPFLAKKAAELKRARAETVLLDDAALAKVMRYESHLNKQLVQTLHLLERLQAVRSDNPPVPPLAVDVFVEGGNGVEERAG